MKHTGKIGRLSKDRRNELAHRIENGETGAEIVNWLNAQPDVRKILEAQFAGRPISEQDLSDFKQTVPKPPTRPSQMKNLCQAEVRCQAGVQCHEKASKIAKMQPTKAY